MSFNHQESFDVYLRPANITSNYTEHLEGEVRAVINRNPYRMIGGGRDGSSSKSRCVVLGLNGIVSVGRGVFHSDSGRSRFRVTCDITVYRLPKKGDILKGCQVKRISSSAGFYVSCGALEGLGPDEVEKIPNIFVVLGYNEELGTNVNLGDVFTVKITSIDYISTEGKLVITGSVVGR